MKTPAQRHHRIDYVELTVHDLEEAQRFYASAFGWSFTFYGPSYCGIVGSEGGEFGGLSLAEPQPQQSQPSSHHPTLSSAPGPLVILFSAEIDATERAVLAAGGTVTIPQFDFPGGRRFHFTDPSGNPLAVWAEPRTGLGE